MLAGRGSLNPILARVRIRLTGHRDPSPDVPVRNDPRSIAHDREIAPHVLHDDVAGAILGDVDVQIYLADGQVAGAILIDDHAASHVAQVGVARIIPEVDITEYIMDV